MDRALILNLRWTRKCQRGACALTLSARMMHAHMTKGLPMPQQRTMAPLFTWRSAVVSSDLPASTKLVALALSLYMNERGGSAFPGATRLAADTSLHLRTVKRLLTELTDAEWLVLARRGGTAGDRRQANEYVAQVPDGWHSTTGGTRTPVAPDAAPVALDTTTGVPVCTDQWPHATPILHEVISEHTSEVTMVTPAVIAPGFAEFWNTYPRKAGKAKALQAWTKAVRKAEPATIIAGARTYTNDPNRVDEFTKHGATWLNGECWNDPPLPARAPERVRHDRGQGFMRAVLTGQFDDDEGSNGNGHTRNGRQVSGAIASGSNQPEG